MTIFDTVKETVNTAVDTISSVAQNLVDKNRTNAKLNRLRLIMKNECELMNRAYIALGKQYYDMQKTGSVKREQSPEKLIEVIEKSKAKIAKARECYRQIVDSQNDIFYGKSEPAEYNSEDVVDITVACSNENEYEKPAFSEAEQTLESKVDMCSENSAEASAENKVEAGAEDKSEASAECASCESAFTEEIANEIAEISSKVDEIDEKLDEIAEDIFPDADNTLELDGTDGDDSELF